MVTNFRNLIVISSLNNHFGETALLCQYLLAWEISKHPSLRIASVSVGLGSKERPRNGFSIFCPRDKSWGCTKKRQNGVGKGKEGNSRGLSASVSFALTLPHPPHSFGSRPIFRAGKTPILSLLTETLATLVTNTLVR